ncbi:methyl-CpG-binding domain protein 4-like protein isoform X2 [Homalodisca vitripennis]|uniref:methyl-CpG-binding domain protein 4-like protein isoform X2 n=1 Tax=Homalodisca vitripennis TaxID=197043 RepID=UPI001EEC3DE1|nr:methyl-CpG-binding domain protein 4-like protein isoform X2 [Homalodisca vitripennis]
MTEESVSKIENHDNECINEEQYNPSELLQTYNTVTEINNVTIKNTNLLPLNTQEALESIKNVEHGNKSPKSECNKNDSLCTKLNVNHNDTGNQNDFNEVLESEQLSSSPCHSKKRLQNTKRRAGVLYKQLKSSKLCKVNSKYFSEANKPQKQWIPPRSPYSLVQEDLFDNPWQLLVATIFLTKTAAKRALPQLHKFLAQYSRPEDILQASYEDIDEYFKPLGLTNTRSHTIMRFTVHQVLR